MTKLRCNLCDAVVESIAYHYPTEHGLNASVYYAGGHKEVVDE